MRLRDLIRIAADPGSGGEYADTDPLPTDPRSTLPQKFARGSGVLLNCNGLVLLLRRAQEPHKGFWGLPGGDLPTTGPRRSLAWDSASSACLEELGSLPPGFGKARARHVMANPKTCKDFTTFVVELPSSIYPWKPRLNSEHDAWVWVDPERASTLQLLPDVKRLLRCEDLWGSQGNQWEPENDELKAPFTNSVMRLMDQGSDVSRPQDIDNHPYTPGDQGR